MEDTPKSMNSNFWANLFKTPTEKNDLETLLKSLPPFSKLELKHIKNLAKLIHNRSYAANEVIFAQGDPGIGLFIIREGEVEIRYSDEENTNHVLAKFSQGDFFGELSAIDEDFRSASAVSVIETKLAVLFRPDLDDFIDTHPKLGVSILRGFSHIIISRLKKINNDFVTLSSKNN